MQLVGGLFVVDLINGNHTTTDSAGEFAVTIPDRATRASLRVAEDRSDRRTSLIDVDNAPIENVLAPVVSTTLWATYLAALHVTDDPTRATIHISFPAPGAFVGSAFVAGATQILYNQGDPFAWASQPPGDQTISIMAFGVAIDSGTTTVQVLSRTDQVIYDAVAHVQAGGITWIHLP